IILLSRMCKDWYEGALSAARQAAATRIILRPYPQELQLALRAAGRPIEDLPVIYLKDHPQNLENDSFWWNPIGTSSIQAADMPHAVMRFVPPKDPLHHGLVFYSRAPEHAAFFSRREGLHAFISFRHSCDSAPRNY